MGAPKVRRFGQIRGKRNIFNHIDPCLFYSFHCEAGYDLPGIFYESVLVGRPHYLMPARNGIPATGGPQMEFLLRQKKHFISDFLLDGIRGRGILLKAF